MAALPRVRRSLVARVDRVLGQREATDAVAAAILRARAGLHGIERPRGAFLFLGPTGVGKTELAKVLAAELLRDHILEAKESLLASFPTLPN